MKFKIGQNYNYSSKNINKKQDDDNDEFKKIALSIIYSISKINI